VWRRISFCLVGALVSFCCSPSENPPVKITFDHRWLFRIDPEHVGTAQMWFSPEHPHVDWDSVRVPGSWEVYEGMERYDGFGWFAKGFHLDDTGQPLSLHFGGIDDDAVVWLNGMEVGSHEGHSDPFAVDVTRAVRRGENLLVVRVHDHGGGGGIYAPVSLVDSASVLALLKGKFHDMGARPSADWVRDAVIYEVYLRSFSREGTFQALERRLPELKELGITVLWLMPIHPVGLAQRKGTLGSPYAVRDFHAVNPEFGTMDDFRSLVAATHRLGMKLIIDLVINHTAWDNPLIRDHPDWYSKDSSGAIVPPNADWTDVADLDYSNASLRQWMSAMMEYWIRDIGIDGYRCDVAELVPTDFWEEVRGKLEAIKPVMMLSEGSLPEHHLRAFDITYAWNTYDALGALLSGRKPAQFLDQVLASESLRFPRGSLRLRFNTNHDKNAWDMPAAMKYGADGLKLATVLINTIPGVPLMYTGEEVANSRRLDLFEKVEVDWNQPRTIGALSRTLFHLRHDGTALKRGTMTRLAAQPREAVYAFMRSSDNEDLLVVLNFSPDPQDCSVSLPAPLAGAEVDLVDVMTKEVLQVRSGAREFSPGSLEGHGYRVYLVKKS
jgi:glycosidase